MTWVDMRSQPAGSDERFAGGQSGSPGPRGLFRDRPTSRRPPGAGQRWCGGWEKADGAEVLLKWESRLCVWSGAGARAVRGATLHRPTLRRACAQPGAAAPDPRGLAPDPPTMS